MNISIQPLPAEVVNLIAAGEVIDSLAAVVRELAENALDAQATRITISLFPQQWRVRVADNGMGMSLADLQQAAAAHSTSKISQWEDLWQISSLGFRGEALHSLAALAELEILSCPNLPDSWLQRESEGWRIVYSSQGEAMQVENAAIAPGTIVTVSHLFSAWTARRQGLPPLSQQLRTVQTTIYHLALCHPHVTWQVQQDDRQWFTISSGATAKQILPQILREVRFSDLQYWDMGTEGELDSLTQNSKLRAGTEALPLQNSKHSSQSPIALVLGLPDRCHRHRPDWVKVAVNGRIVRSLELESTILASFHRTLPRDRFPICFVHLQIPPEQIDWNRHPAKAEIYLQNLSHWQAEINAAIESALLISPANLADADRRVGKLLKASEEKLGYNFSRAIQSDESEAATTDEVGLIRLRAIAQVHNMYILVEHPGGMWLVEQHIAHERVLYEQLCDRWQLVPLEPPIILDRLSPAQLEQLERIGIQVEPFGEQLWAVRHAPEPLSPRPDCAAALLELSLGGDLQAAQVATACRTAIRNGTTLNLSEMQSLLDQWHRTKNPRTCPHGRPIYLSLEESALARFFRRHWVIGKSHGFNPQFP